MSKEKELTDEEIVKALEHCGSQHHIKGCKDCPMQGIENCYDEPLTDNALNLIHRLQAENAELKEDNERWETMFHICEERKYRKLFNEEWKKEYQKELDKQGKGLIAGSPDFDYVYQRYFEQKAEIEQLTERLDYFQKLSDYHEGNQKELEAKNTELQKQVDELKERNYWLESEHEHQCEKSYFDGVEKGQQQAVKDTAEKFADKLRCEYIDFDDTDEVWVGGLREDISKICKEITKK